MRGVFILRINCGAMSDTMNLCNYDITLTDILCLLSPGGAITRPLQDVTVAESQTAQFECEVANADAEGRWLKEGQLMDFSENVVSEVEGAVRRLTIVITRPQDVGEYSYQVANSKTTANLKVEGKLLSTSREHASTNQPVTAVKRRLQF